jgi:thiol-disulfide isomerase/thioredoxin
MAGVRPVAVVMAACAAMALAGCGERTQAADPGAGQPPSSPVVRQTVTASASASASLPPPVAVKVPEQLKFTAKTVDGKDFDGASLAGRPAVLWFWAPWCPKCQGEAEDIAAAAKETEGAVSFLGVAAQDQVPAMQDFVQRFGLGSFPHLADTDAAVWKRFGVTYQPAYAFITADGSVDLVTKQLATDDLRNRVRALAG